MLCVAFPTIKNGDGLMILWGFLEQKLLKAAKKTLDLGGGSFQAATIILNTEPQIEQTGLGTAY